MLFVVLVKAYECVAYEDVSNERSSNSNSAWRDLGGRPGSAIGRHVARYATHWFLAT
jgi:hypothetical protein